MALQVNTNYTKIRFSPGALDELTDDEQRAMGEIERIVNEVSQREGIEIDDIEVESKDYLKQERTPYVRIGIHTPPSVTHERASDLWDSAGEAIEDWVKAQPAPFRKAWDKKIWYAVEWIE